MPTTYTHDVFGKKVYQMLSDELQEKIREHKMSYLIGLHGPDLLFYYQPRKENEVNIIGHRMHQETAADFFKECRRKYNDTKNDDILVYTLGFICHYMLDSTCHPYISRYMEKTGAGHDEIETDLDRTLMEKYGKNPFTFHPVSHLKSNKETMSTIAEIIGVSPSIIQHCLRAMKFYTSVVVCRTRVKRKLLLIMIQSMGIYDETEGRIMRRFHSKRCETSSIELISLIRCTIPETVTVIEEFYQTIDNPEELGGRFYRNYK